MVVVVVLDDRWIWRLGFFCGFNVQISRACVAVCAGVTKGWL